MKRGLGGETQLILSGVSTQNLLAGHVECKRDFSSTPIQTPSNRKDRAARVHFRLHVDFLPRKSTSAYFGVGEAVAFCIASATCLA